MRIRRASAAELPALQGIERAAGERFRTLGMDAIADDEPPTRVELTRFLHADGLRVLTVAGELAGYVLTEPVDGCAHVEQLSVAPQFAHRGLGRRLLDDVAHRASVAGRPAVTLTTYAEVPWNAPYYARLGFRALQDAEVTPGLRAIRRHEQELGLDRWPRVCMRRETGDARNSPPAARG